MGKLTTILAFALFFAQSAWAQFSALTNLTSLPITTDTKEKPQSKVWIYDHRYWAVLADSAGSHIWRLDGTAWTKIFTISTSKNARADCKVAGNVVHIFLFRKSTSYLVSVEYVPSNNSYKLWPARTSNVPLTLHPNAETATIDIDTKGRMWMVSDEDTTITVRWSNFPYANWSKPITVASGVNPDDIGAVTALPMLGKIGVLWSNQITKRFGFKLHTDGTDPTLWSEDEVPASQSALDVGAGFADDHLNMKVARDGTLYCAVKTSYDQPYTRIGLLIRRPAGTWDSLYAVSENGTRGIVVLNEQLGKVRIVYSENEAGGDILYKESAISRIAFGQQFTLIRGKYNHSTCMKSNHNSDAVILASDSVSAVGVLATDVVQRHELTTDVAQLHIGATPNPFHTVSNIQFTIPADSKYSVKLYNITGKLIDILMQGYATVGETHATDINASQLPFGLYVLSIQTDKGGQTLKLIHH